MSVFTFASTTLHTFQGKRRRKKVCVSQDFRGGARDNVGTSSVGKAQVEAGVWKCFEEGMEALDLREILGFPRD